MSKNKVIRILVNDGYYESLKSVSYDSNISINRLIKYILVNNLELIKNDDNYIYTKNKLIPLNITLCNNEIDLFNNTLKRYNVSNMNRFINDILENNKTDINDIITKRKPKYLIENKMKKEDLNNLSLDELLDELEC